MGTDLTVVNAVRVSFDKNQNGRQFQKVVNRGIDSLMVMRNLSSILQNTIIGVLLDTVVCSFISGQSLLQDNLSNTKSVWCGMKYLDDMWMMNQSSIHLKFGD